MPPRDRTPGAQSTDKPRTINLGSARDFPPGDRREVTIGALVIAVFNIGGDYHAIYGRCPHQFAPLCRGRLQGTVIQNAETGWKTRWAYEGEVVTCPGHAMEYHIKTGKAFGYDLKLRTFDVAVEDGDVVLSF